MSDIKDNSYKMEIGGREYRLLFSLNALDALQDRYGGYDKLDEYLSKDNPGYIKELRWLFTLLINEGLLSEDENAEPLSEEKVGRMLHAGNLAEATAAIYASFSAGVSGSSRDGAAQEDEDMGEA